MKTQMCNRENVETTKSWNGPRQELEGPGFKFSPHYSGLISDYPAGLLLKKMEDFKYKYDES